MTTSSDHSIFKESPNTSNILDIIRKVKLSCIKANCDKLDAKSWCGSDSDFYKEINLFMFTFILSRLGMTNGVSIFRARKHEDNEFFSNLSELTYPPSECVSSLGRLNYSNQSLYYAAQNPMIAMSEVTSESKERESVGHCTLIRSVVNNNSDLHLANLYPLSIKNKPHDSTDYLLKDRIETDQTLRNYFSKKDEEKVRTQKNYIANRITCDKENVDYNCYRITAGIANILFDKFKFNGLIYPNASMNKISPCMAFTPEVYDKCFTPVTAQRVRYSYRKISGNKNKANKEILCSFNATHHSKGSIEKGNFEWMPAKNKNITTNIYQYTI